MLNSEVVSFAINSGGYVFAGTYFGGVYRSVQPTTVVKEITHSLATSFGLHQNYPNPFNPTTIIRYELPVKGWVTLKIFDIIGRETAVLVNEERTPGEYEVTWDAAGLPGGVYFYRLQVGLYVDTKKLVLLR